LIRVTISRLTLLMGVAFSLSARAQQAVDATAAADPVCEAAGRQAERAYDLPSGLLLAIGRVESGRWDPTQGRIVPWPWAVDANGTGKLFESKADAVTRTTALRAGGTPNIDVGCFQIDLTSHPGAFATLDQAFDPFSNADYAGRFLVNLHARTGTWDAAVAAYHSMQPDRGTAYRQRVFADWALTDRITGSPAAPGPLVVQFASGASMRIWTPGNAQPPTHGTTLSSDTVAALPRVVIGRPYAR
jgi:hypothetical protein